MAFVSADRVSDTTTVTGTGNVTVSGVAPTGYRTLSAVLSVGDTFYYCISDQTTGKWETGTGTYVSANVFARTTVLSSSNSGSLVAFTDGVKTVFVTFPAAQMLQTTPGTVGASAITSVTTGSTTARTLANRFQHPFNVLDYGASTDGSTSSTAAFQAAIAACGAAGGGTIFIPASPNPYIVGDINVNVYNNISFVGENQTTLAAGGVKLQASSTTASIFNVSSVGGINFENILFTSASQQTSGAYVTFTNSNSCSIKKCHFNYGYDNININGCGSLVFDTISIRDFNHDGVYITGNSNDLYFNYIIMDQASAIYTPNAGFELPYMGGSFVLTNSDILHCHKGLLVNPGAGQYSIWGYLSNVFFDTSDFDIPTRQGIGMSFVPTNGGIVQGWKFTNVWSSTGYIGIRLIADGTSTLSRMDFANVQVLNNYTNGVQLSVCSDVNFVNPDIYGNSTASSGTYAGVLIGNFCESIKFSMGEIGGTISGFTNQHSYAIETQAGFTGVLTVNGTKMSAANTPPVLLTGSPAIGSSISQSAGYNPVGTSLQIVGASPYTYTAGLSTEIVNLYGGTVVVTTINGVTVATASPCSFTLAPKQSAIISYATIPTMAVNKL